MKKLRVAVAPTWSSSALMAAAALASAALVAASAASGSEAQLPRHFATPSGNIFCSYFSIPGRPGVDCVIKSGWIPPLPRRGPGCSRSYWLSLTTAGSPKAKGSVCEGEDDPEGPYIGLENAQVLAYGRTLRVGGIRCTSAMTGLTCRNKSGHGFFLSRERWRKF